LVDGFHRLFAHKRADYKEIEVNVHQGTLRDAQFYALGVNDKHGLQRTNADKRKAVMIALNDLEWQDWSDIKLGRICNVSPTFVAKCKKEAKIERPIEKTYTTKHGTEAKMDTSKIGKPKTEKPAKPKVEPAPVTELAPLEKYTSTEGDQLNELSHVNAELHAENLKLHDKMTVLSGDQEVINSQFESLRSQITGLEAEMKAVKNSRDQFQAKNADLIKQVNYWRKRAEKAEKTK
jgi:cell division protein FtsB